MSATIEHLVTLPRVPTGSAGLDRILGGGLLKGGLYIVCGSPGSGKTILGNQLCFHHVANGGRALYVTLLAESHGRMISFLSSMSFFDRSAVGSSLLYLSGFTTIESEGLHGLLRLVQKAVRDHRASLLVLDGLVTAGVLARSDIDYKKFIVELQTWLGVVGCTVVFLSSAGAEGGTQPEYTMVDGVIELSSKRLEFRTIRQLAVQKFRGSAILEGVHSYLITSSGLAIHPRLEALPPVVLEGAVPTRRLSTGIAGFDAMLDGGLACASTSLILGSSGAGKTVLGMHFLAAGAAAGERGLHFGFFEQPATLLEKADRFKLDFRRHVREAAVRVVWNRPSEQHMDALAEQLLDHVKRHEIKRLFIDGLVGFKETESPSRLSAFFSALSRELILLGVTTLITEETRELFVQEIEVPTVGVSAVFHNIFFMRQVEVESELQRLISVMKTRDSKHDRALHQFEIDDDGIRIGPKFSSGGAVLTGVAHTDQDPGVGKHRSRR